MTDKNLTPPSDPQDNSAAALSPRKSAIRDLADRMAPNRDAWIERNAYFHQEDHRYFQFLIPEGLKVLELGCGTGDLLASLKPSHGIGIDISPGMVEAAAKKFPDLEFHTGDIEDPSVFEALDGPFDVIIVSDTVGDLEDVEATFQSLHDLCGLDTRIVVAYQSTLWSFVLELLTTHGALEECRSRALASAERALTRIEGMRPSAYVEGLRQAVHYAVARSH